MSNDELLTIPDFLKREPQPEPKYKEVKKKWWMPDLLAYKKEQEEREKRKQELEEEKLNKQERKAKKKRTQNYVLDAIKKEYNTLGKMVKFIPNAEENEIRAALRKLISLGDIKKVSRKVYSVT